MSRYSEAKEIYAGYGIDTEKALETSLKILNSISDENGDIDSTYKRELRLR